MKILKTVLMILAVCAAGFWLIRPGAPPSDSNPPTAVPAPVSPAIPMEKTPSLTPVSERAGDEAASGAVKDVCAECGQVHPGFVCAMYGGQRIMTVPDLSPGNIRTTVEKLSSEAQKRALLQLSRMNFRSFDESSVRIDSAGMIYYVCTFNNAGIPAPENIPEAEAGAAEVQSSALILPLAAPLPVSTPPVYHSKPGSTNVLFLDFNGHDVSGTRWNQIYTVTVWRCTAFDIDGDTNTFSDTEQRYIKEIWERVSEDYAVFDVDVTTEQPASWTRNTAHALITPTVDASGVECPHYGAGGYAYVNIFGLYRCSYNDPNCYSPAWVKTMSGNSYANTAEAASHELGHNLGLDHDGSGTNIYYYGHTNGSLSWGPIMGAAYGKNVSQWSKGEYYGANRFEDDLTIVSNKLKYRSDDYSNTIAQAASLLTSGGVFAVTGIVERTGDSDMFKFTCVDGTLVLTGATYRCSEGPWGGNADLVMTLYDAGGTLIASNNPELETKTVITQTVAGGTYYVKVSPTGVGSPTNNPPSGYTSYGSVGPYTVAGIVPLPDRDIDGMPDNWELQYFGGETNANASAVASNGINTVLEAYIAGLNPTSRTSFFKVNTSGTSAATNGGFVVGWNSASGRVYSVLQAASLQNNFQPLATNIVWPQASYTDTVHGAESGSFYKVKVQLAP